MFVMTEWSGLAIDFEIAGKSDSACRQGRVSYLSGKHLGAAQSDLTRDDHHLVTVASVMGRWRA